MNVIYFLITLSALLWGAITDYKTREIENGVHVLLILAGFFSGLSIWQHLIGLVVPLLVLFIMEKLFGKTVGDGDVKLLAALGFNVGLFTVCVVVAISGGMALIAARKQKSIPLCTYVCAGSVAVFAASFAFQLI